MRRSVPPRTGRRFAAPSPGHCSRQTSGQGGPVEKLKVDDLNPAEQLELESILQAHRQGDSALTRKFYSSFQDAFAWWLFLLLGSVGGFIAIFIAFSPHEIARDYR